MRTEYVIALVIIILAGAGAGYLFLSSPAGPASSSEMPTFSITNRPYKEIVDPSGFVNTGTDANGNPNPITIGEFIGKKVVLIDFLTYSCINCQRTFPYLNAWYEKYKDQGLEVIGIHTPEFAFEKDIDNVREAMKEFGIEHPVVLDNDYSTWRAYGNKYWPRKYLIDIHGNIVYDHIGEGAYEETEQKIREALAERAKVLGEKEDMGGDLAASSVPVNTIEAKSPETYFGSMRNEYLANGARGRAGEQNFSVPDPVALSANMLYLGGTWNITSEYAEAVSEASVVYKFNAKGVYIVGDADASTEVEVLIDGKPAADTDDVKNGVVQIGESRLYILQQAGNAGEHTLELKVPAGVRFYAFTFG